VTSRIIVIDACCLLNLLATRREVELAAALGASLVVTPQAQGETCFLCGPPEPDDEEQLPTRVPVELSPLLRSGRLRVHDFGEEVAEAFELCANFLRDADASSVALAATLKVALASDDGKVQKVARRLYPELPVISTLQLVREGVERLGVVGEGLRELLCDLRLRGNFEPPRRDPERAWFEAVMNGK
jgi:predicted nucleic acid-binding protein